MPPTDLHVPFHEKDEAKKLGALWDPARKVWFLPDGKETGPFKKWLPQQSDINLRASTFFLAESMRACWHCTKDTRVFSFLLPRGHSELQDDEESAQWEVQRSEAVVYYVTRIPASVQAKIRAITPHYRHDFSKTTQSWYWMNHCERCGMKQGDFELFEEFDTPFCPIEPQDASRILLRSVREAFEASAASIAYEPGFFEWMRMI